MKKSPNQPKNKRGRPAQPAPGRAGGQGHPAPSWAVLGLKTRSFLSLVDVDPELAALRRKYAEQPAEERRVAADWQYHAAIAGEMFELALAKTTGESMGLAHWPAGVLALTIDPLYAPALLTVGAMEYQYGRTS